MDDLTRQRLKQPAMEYAEAIERAAEASIVWDEAFDDCVKVICKNMRATHGEDADNVSLGHAELHAMAIGLADKKILDRVHEILDEEEDGNPDPNLVN